ncbi:hypothetical protein H2200_005517 [Cladophialophora chaetospira]|uniref:C2H2-type domain-containing protein n=1 Tax=Cladophialophora chaetospira TaxID=386627 RepID=A0AA39CJP7_9EURO|nr:hypothetical protein H2200_005517 [Cladophialophora chaetospira]
MGRGDGKPPPPPPPPRRPTVFGRRIVKSTAWAEKSLQPLLPQKQAPVSVPYHNDGQRSNIASDQNLNRNIGVDPLFIEEIQFVSPADFLAKIPVDYSIPQPPSNLMPSPASEFHSSYSTIPSLISDSSTPYSGVFSSAFATVSDTDCQKSYGEPSQAFTWNEHLPWRPRGFVRESREPRNEATDDQGTEFQTLNMTSTSPVKVIVTSGALRKGDTSPIPDPSEDALHNPWEPYWDAQNNPWETEEFLKVSPLETEEYVPDNSWERKDPTVDVTGNPWEGTEYDKDNQREAGDHEELGMRQAQPSSSILIPRNAPILNAENGLPDRSVSLRRSKSVPSRLANPVQQDMPAKEEIPVEELSTESTVLMKQLSTWVWYDERVQTGLGDSPMAHEPRRMVEQNTPVSVGREGDDSQPPTSGILGGESPIKSEDLCVESSGEESFVLNENNPSVMDDMMREYLESVAFLLGQVLAREFLSSAPRMTILTPQTSAESSDQSDGSTSDVSASSEAGSSRLHPDPVQSSCGRGRSRGDEEGDDNDEEEEVPHRKKPRLNQCDSQNPESHPLLACPYAKYDPIRYSERNSNLEEKRYRRCSTICLTSIARLKQHLYRVHNRPEYYCSSCFAIFGSKGEYQEHSRARPACDVKDCPFSEKMDEDQFKSVKRRKPGEEPRAAWFGIFRVLFPTAQLPHSPYVGDKDLPVIAQTAEQYMDFLVDNLPRRASLAIGPSFTDENPMFQYLLSSVIEQSLGIIIQELYGEFRALEPVTQSNSDGG